MTIINVGERFTLRIAPGMILEGYINHLGDFVTDPEPDHSFTD